MKKYYTKYKQTIATRLAQSAFIVFCLLFCAMSLTAQTPRTEKVGLVLSGGGAKGMAHIGVIRALEENGIPIDYIAGTSVGAIVGGLYASGYSTSEIEAIFISPQFNKWMRENVRDNYIYYFKRNDPNPSWLEPLVKVDSSGVLLTLPTSIISPQQIDFEFMNIYSGAGAAAKGNFDSLFVPFRCAAANLNAQKPYYFNHGNLPTAIRASMTFPFVFKPVVIDSIIFFDGGLYDNFPVKPMQNDFNPDVIIGVQVAENFPPPQKGDLISYLQKMIAQPTDFSIGNSKGIVLVPFKTPELNLINFSETCAMEQTGYQTAIDAMDSIKKIVVDSVPQSEVENRRRIFNNKIPPLIVDTVIVSGVTNMQAKYIQRLIYTSKTGKPVLEKLRNSYFRLFSDENIQSIYPKLLYDTLSQKFKLFLDVDINNAIVPKIGGYLSVGAPSEAFLEISYRRLQRIASLYRISAYLGSFYNSISAYTRFDFPTKMPFYIAGEYTFNRWNYFNDDLFQSESPSLTHLTKYEQHVKLEFGTPMGKSGKLCITPSLNREDDYYKEANVIYKTDKPDYTTFNSFALSISVERNTLDKPQYASRGGFSRLSAIGIIGEEMYKSSVFTSYGYEKEAFHKWVQLSYQFQKYYQLFKPYSIGISVDVSTSWQDNFFNYPSTLLHTPAFCPTVESKQYFMPEYRANFYGGLGLQNVIKLYQELQLRIEGYVFLPYRETTLEYKDEKIISLFDFTHTKPLFVFSGGLVYHSPIGPISLLVNYHQRENTSISPFSVILNIGYVLFNKKGY